MQLATFLGGVFWVQIHGSMGPDLNNICEEIWKKQLSEGGALCSSTSHNASREWYETMGGEWLQLFFPKIVLPIKKSRI